MRNSAELVSLAVKMTPISIALVICIAIISGYPDIRAIRAEPPNTPQHTNL
jgi:hypothetical protein